MPLVTFTRWVPSLLMVKMSIAIEGLVESVKAIFLPSGDQLMTEPLDSLAPAVDHMRESCVSSLWFVPSAFITLMKHRPVLSWLTKAILVPSGDHVGNSSRPGPLVRR